MTPTDDPAVEAAARAMYESQPHYQGTKGARLTWDDFPCNEVEPRSYWLRMARAALIAAELAAWRGIETAPRDNAWVQITGHATYGAGGMRYPPVMSARRLDGVWSIPGACGFEPTHWRPLPAPPDGGGDV